MLFYLILIGVFLYFSTGLIKNLIYIAKAISDYFVNKEIEENSKLKTNKKTLKE